MEFNKKTNWNNSTARLPKTNWNDITVADFQYIFNLEKEDPEDKLLKLIALVNGIDYEDVLEMPITELEEHFEDIDFLGREPQSVLVKGAYELNGRVYKVYMKELTTAQYIDFKQLADRHYEHLAQFLTVFIIPAKHRYGDGYDLDVARQDIETMPITDARAVASFFLTRYAISTRLFLRYSIAKLRKEMRRTKDPKEKRLIKEAIERAKKTLKDLRPTTPTGRRCQAPTTGSR